MKLEELKPNSILLKELLETVTEIPASLDYDAFGRILDPVRGGRARLLMSGKTIAASRTAGQCRFAIKSILDHEVVVIG